MVGMGIEGQSGRSFTVTVMVMVLVLVLVVFVKAVTKTTVITREAREGQNDQSVGQDEEGVGWAKASTSRWSGCRAMPEKKKRQPC